ncbi:ABC transporter permease [Bacillota bacterium Meth-B3]|nr:ABC transporter permease [Christensenellaceae bacterium]MEA5064854.1 ABC transporter permease [Eubacteriales bacterium]MEA5069447.1 ABC transporter permease [Christensenellaceae bacterium]
MKLKPVKNFKFLSFHLSPELLEPASTEEKSQLTHMRESVTYWQDAMRRLRANKVAMTSAWILLAVLLFAWVGPMLMPYQYDQQIRGAERMAPTLDPFHPFGTDNLGRDLMVRVMIGTRISMTIGIVASLIILIIGTTYGAISGYLGGWVDNVMMRVVEIVYAIPDALVVIILGISLKDPLQKLLDSGGLKAFASVGSGLISIFLTFALLYWVSMARIVRGQVIALKGSEYVTAARAMGAKSGWIIKKHLVPNCIGTIIVTTMFQIPSAIFTESFLSFIGLGVSAPMASLGSLVNDALNGFQSYPYRLMIPAAMIAVIILAFNQFGDGLRDALDPRMRG